MSCEKANLCKISYVTDFDTSMYQLGEVDGSFDEKQLEDYINSYGSSDLLEHLSYLQYQVVKTTRKLNQGKSELVQCQKGCE